MPAAATRPLRQAVLRPHQSLDELAAHEPPDAYAVGAFAGETLIAVGLIGPEGEPGAWRVRGMAAAPEARNMGAGTAILEALIGHALEHGAGRVWANVRIAARTFYERAGLETTSGVFTPPQLGPHIRMERRIRA